VGNDLEAYDAFKVISSDERGMVIEFTLPELEMEEVMVGRERYQSVSVGGANVEADPGFPQIEMFPVLVGVPLNGAAQVALTTIKTEVLKARRILPAKINEDDVEVSYSADFLQGGRYPARMLEVDDPGFLRRQQVVGFRIYPVQVDPDRGEISVIRKARIDLRYTGGDSGRGNVSAYEKGFEGVYKRSLLNYEEARRWRSSPVRQSLSRSSPFFEGEYWLKVIVSDEGIYRITYDDILDLDLTPAQIDPSTFQVFYGGGKELPWHTNDPRPELEEVAIEVNDGGEGSFDPGDEIVFYAQALIRWEDQTAWLRHRYDDNNCYWLTWGNPDAQPLRVASIDGSPSGSGDDIEFYRNLKHVEQDHIYVTKEFQYTNIVADDWVWENVSGPTGVPVSRSYTFQLEETAAGGEDSLKLEVYGQQNTGSHYIIVSVNGVQVTEVTFTGKSRYNSDWFSLPNDLLREGSNTLTLYLPRNTSALSGDAIYMGWFDVNAVYSTENVDDALIFNGQPGSGYYRYRLGGVTANSPLIYEVSDPNNPSLVENYSVQGSDIIFELSSGSQQYRFVYLDRGDYRRPQSITIVDELTLRSTSNGAQYLVITSPELEDEAREIASFRASNDGLITMVVTSERICNEFSWGIFDVTALRDFLMYTYESWAISPTMTLFLGDGHYDYKGITLAGRNKYNPLPPHINNDLVIEDWFVRFDSDPNPEMIYGRIPVRTNQEARIALGKIMDYSDDPEYGAWKSRIILVADDYFSESRGCESLKHTEQIEDLDSRLPEGIEADEGVSSGISLRSP
jgi:hypothetical protein